MSKPTITKELLQKIAIEYEPLVPSAPQSIDYSGIRILPESQWNDCHMYFKRNIPRQFRHPEEYGDSPKLQKEMNKIDDWEGRLFDLAREIRIKYGVIVEMAANM